MKRMTKKSRFARGLAIVLAIAALFALVPLLTSCFMENNEPKYNGVHIFCSNGEDLCFNIRDYEVGSNGYVIFPREGTGFFVSNGTYILYKNICPICSQKEPIE